jgi:hypothetical protein
MVPAKQAQATATVSYTSLHWDAVTCALIAVFAIVPHACLA